MQEPLVFKYELSKDTTAFSAFAAFDPRIEQTSLVVNVPYKEAHFDLQGIKDIRDFLNSILVDENT
jgi:hypothetical protein